jgi:succinate dehydrogenase / fumarate reductase cytochrome b subunit
VIEIYSEPGYVIFYIASMVLVGLHLWHGVSSAFQTVGADAPRWTPALRKFGWTMAIVISVGFMTIPLWVFLFGARS